MLDFVFHFLPEIDEDRLPNQLYKVTMRIPSTPFFLVLSTLLTDVDRCCLTGGAAELSAPTTEGAKRDAYNERLVNLSDINIFYKCQNMNYFRLNDFNCCIMFNLCHFGSE